MNVSTDTELTIADAAKRCHITPNHFRILLRQGVGPKVLKISERKTFIRVSDLEEWLNSRVTNL